MWFWIFVRRRSPWCWLLLLMTCIAGYWPISKVVSMPTVRTWTTPLADSYWLRSSLSGPPLAQCFWLLVYHRRLFRFVGCTFPWCVSTCCNLWIDLLAGYPNFLCCFRRRFFWLFLKCAGSLSWRWFGIKRHYAWRCDFSTEKRRRGPEST